LGERHGLSAIFSFRLNLAARESAGLYLSIFRDNICKAGMALCSILFSISSTTASRGGQSYNP